MQVTHSIGELEFRRRGSQTELAGRKVDEKILDVLRIMSHDVRGALVSISSTLKLLRRGYYGKMDDEVVSVLEELLLKTTGLARMNEEYLSRIFPNNDELEAEGEAIDLVQDIIVPVLEEFSSELKNHPFQIDNSLARASHKRISIKAGGTWLKAVLRNLLRNALKYGGRGCAIALGFEDRGSSWRLNVYNSGKPIPEEWRDKLFSRKATGIGKGNTGGLGLGLYLIKRLIRKQGGDIWYEARHDGSNFVFTLPRV
jgi:signal transduction histidine kinase